MSVISITALKALFQQGDFPNEQAFIDLIETLGGGANGDGNIRVSNLDLTSSQVLSLNSTPIELVAAPGTGKAIQMVSAIARIATYGGSPYATNTSLILIANGASGTDYQMACGSILARTSICIKNFGQQTGGANNVSQYIENSSILATVLTGNPTAGNSDIKIYSSYRIITL